MRIVKLAQRNIKAWLRFFDSEAFKDHRDWKDCYCTYYHYPKIKESVGESKTKREYAQWLIKNGYMNGYLVYNDKKVVGWCNVGDKENYPRVSGRRGEGSEGIKSILCFVIQKEYRRQGIARRLVKRVIKDSKKDGTKVIEAYPNLEAMNEYSHYHGPARLYLDEGFAEEKAGRVKKVVYRIHRR